MSVTIQELRSRQRVYRLGEACILAEVSRSLFQNWTSGRPLRFAPSVRARRGRGSHNLYSLDDLLALRTIYALHCEGMDTTDLKDVCDAVVAVRRSGEPWPTEGFLIVTFASCAPRVEFAPSLNEILAWVGSWFDGQTALSLYIVNLAEVAARVCSRANESPTAEVPA